MQDFAFSNSNKGVGVWRSRCWLYYPWVRLCSRARYYGSLPVFVSGMDDGAVKVRARCCYIAAAPHVLLFWLIMEAKLREKEFYFYIISTRVLLVL